MEFFWDLNASVIVDCFLKFCTPDVGALSPNWVAISLCILLFFVYCSCFKYNVKNIYINIKNMTCFTDYDFSISIRNVK